MSFGIVIKNRPYRFGKTRSEHEKNIRKEWDCKTLTDEQLDKLKYLEKRDNKQVYDQSQIGKVK